MPSVEFGIEGTQSEKDPALTNRLIPETVRTAEFEHTHRLNDETQIVVSGYWSRIDHIIRLKAIRLNGASLFRFQNKSDNTYSAGVEGEVRWTPAPGTMLQLWYAFNQIKNQGDSPDVPNAPAHSGALRAMFPLAFEKLSLSTELIYNSSRLTTTDPANPESQIGDRLIWNAGITGNYAPWRLRYGAFADNLLDQRVSLPGGLEIPFPSHAVPQIGRTFRVAVGASF